MIVEIQSDLKTRERKLVLSYTNSRPNYLRKHRFPIFLWLHDITNLKFQHMHFYFVVRV